MKTRILVASFLALLMTSTAFAQTNEELQLAQTHFDKGAAHYNGAEYAEAITAFQKAFTVVPNALFLYNISLAQAKLGLIDDALATAKKATRYEGMDPKTTARNNARIPAFSINLKANKIAKSLFQVAKRDKKENGDVTLPLQREKRFGALGITGIGLVVLGSGAVVVSGLIANGISNDIPTYEDAAARGDEAEYNRLKNDLGERQTLGQIMLGAGAGVAAIGVTLILIDVFNDEQAPSAFYIMPTKDGANAGVRLAF